jgi:hypothetical protein
MRVTGPALSAACLVLGLGVAWAQGGDTIRPGYWESTTHSSPLGGTKTDRRCVTQKEVARFTSCYINHIYTCVCPQESNAHGEIRFHGVCHDKNGLKVVVSAEGSFTETTLRMTAAGKAYPLGLPIGFSASIDSHRIGDVCPTATP